MSSDALLMNVFCNPSVPRNPKVRALLGIVDDVSPTFGFAARVPLLRERKDRTSIDMKWGTLIIEAKLTESDFQSQTSALVESYRDLDEVFDRVQLPRVQEKYDSYQLIRNVLAAFCLNLSFCVLLDARRPDLIQRWYAVMQCIRITELRTRCKVLTWQELSESLPQNLRKFLDYKYGIVPPGEDSACLQHYV
jgi:hypothetical protein